MEIRDNTTKEISMRKSINGVSTINHRIRIELNISLEEYVLLDFIYNWNLKSKEIIKFSDYQKATGFINEDILKLFEAVKKKKLLIKDFTKNRIDVSDDWKAIFSTDGTINTLWSIHPKGNKKVANLKLSKVLKKISIEELADKLQKYVNWCNANDTFKKDLSTWLNPEFEHWNNVLDKSKFPEKPKIINQIKFKNES